MWCHKNRAVALEGCHRALRGLAAAAAAAAAELLGWCRKNRLLRWRAATGCWEGLLLLLLLGC